MFKKIAYAISLASLLSGFVGAAVAASLSDQWYLGAGYSNSLLQPRAELNNVTRTEEIGQGATVFFGRDFDELSSGQIQLYSLGDVIFSDDSTASYTGADASLLYRFYDSRDNHRNARFGLSVYGRFGFGFLERESTNPIRTDGSSPVYFGAGAGFEAYVSDMFAFRSEFIFHETDSVSAGLSLVARFGGKKSRGGFFGLPELPVTPSTPPNTNVPLQTGTPKETIVAPVAMPQALPIPSSQSNQTASSRRGSASNLDDSFDATGSLNTGLPEVAIMVDPSELNDPAISTTRPQALKPAVTPRIQTDSDNDGITDDIDKCLESTQNYPVSQNGCSLLMQLGDQIKFVERSPLPLPRTERVLQQLAKQMMQFPRTKIELIAHTDNSGDSQANSSLARQRLRAIGIYLVRRGITQDRFLLRSFGDKRPLFDNDSAESRQANNRIEIIEKP